MSEDKTGPAGRAVPTQVLVRGGTTSSRRDRQIADAEHRAKVGRAHQDRQQAAVRTGPRLDKSGFTMAKLHQARMLDRGNAMLVLQYMQRDGTVKQECVSEVIFFPELLFVMVCPRCLERGDPQGHSQMQIKHSHRKFHLDTRRAGEMVIVRDPDNVPHPVRICGTVTCDDVIRCDNCGTFAVRIDDSKVWEM